MNNNSRSNNNAKSNLTPQDIKRFNGYIWKFFISCFALVAILIGLTSLGVFGDLPTLDQLEHPKSDQASQIISGDDKLLGTWYKSANRASVTYNQINPCVFQALIAKEDNHFYAHSGIDFWRVFSSIGYTLTGHKQGASTITQQLALNQFSGEERAKNPISRFVQKLKEQIIAIRLEKHYSKQEIITMYLNAVDFGNNATGIKSAAATYFNTTPDKLTPPQAATLIQILRGTTQFSPIKHPAKARQQRNFTLMRMVAEGFLTQAEAVADTAKPLGLKFHPASEGLAPYFLTELKKQVQTILTERDILKSDGSKYDLYHDGLKVYTTIDSRMQEYAEEAQKEYMKVLQKQFNDQWKGYNLSRKINNYDLLINRGMTMSDRYRELKSQNLSDEEIKQNFNTPDTINLFTWHGVVDTIMKPIDSVLYCQMLLRNSLMSMDPTTGYIKAWVGGIDYEHFKYDEVKLGNRQVGSTAKPFTYAVAINNGFSPCLQVPNTPVTITGYGPDWTPKESPQEVAAGPILTLRKALANSINYVTAELMKQITPEPVQQMITNMGITTKVDPYPSICLGVFNASVYEMTGAYSAFVNHGKWTKPVYLLRIEDRNGHVLYNNVPIVKPALSEETAYVMTDMLKSVITEGTGARLRGRYGLTNPIAGKTGTTQENSDGWFIGMTPQLVTGVWTGCENRDFHFISTTYGEGANSALPIFAGFMKRVYDDPMLGIKKNIDFELPKKPLGTQLDCNLYNQQIKGTPTTVDKKLSF